jgi:hypothetical protein
MINLDTFALHIDRLMTWFGTNLKPEEIEWLYESLTTKLDDEQFKVACQVIFDTKSKGYPGNFPSVKEFVEAVQGTASDQGLKQWQQVLGMVKNSHTRDSYKLDPIASKSLQLMGGLDVLGSSSPKDLTWFRKEFLSNYEAVSRAYQRNEVSVQLTGRSILELNGQAPKQLSESNE